MAIRNIFDREKRERRRDRILRVVAWLSFLTLFVLAADRALLTTFPLPPA